MSSILDGIKDVVAKYISPDTSVSNEPANIADYATPQSVNGVSGGTSQQQQSMGDLREPEQESDASWYDRTWRAYKDANLKVSDQDAYYYMTNIINSAQQKEYDKVQAWNDRYNNVISDLKSSNSFYRLQEKINYYEKGGEIKQFRDSGLDIDEEIIKIKRELGISLVNNYSDVRIDPQDSLPPTSFVFSEAPDGISKEKGLAYEMQKQYDKDKLCNAFAEYYEGLLAQSNKEFQDRQNLLNYTEEQSQKARNIRDFIFEGTVASAYLSSGGGLRRVAAVETELVVATNVETTAAKVVKGPSNALVKDTSSISKNTENLRTWAQDNGWVQQNTAGGVEQWGVRNADGTFSWRLKLKPEASTREGLGAGSNQPRFDARLDDKGTYINPFTGETGGRGVGTHIPLGE